MELSPPLPLLFFFYFNTHSVKKWGELGAGEMAQWVKVFAGLLGGTVLVLTKQHIGWYTTTYNFSLGIECPLLASVGTPTHLTYTDTHTPTHTQGGFELGKTYKDA